MAHPFFKTLISKPIFLILILALGLRLWGITYGFPLFLVKDEPTLIYGALKMVELKTLVPAFHQDEFRKVLYYPPLPSYFYLVALSPFIAVHYYFISGAQSLGQYRDVLALNPSFIWIIGRLFNVLLGLLNIFTIYLLAKKIFGSERAGLFAALFLSLSFYHLQLSQVIRHWMPATLLIFLVWLLAVDVARGKASFKKYLGIGFLLGVAAGGVNTASIIAIIPFFFAHFCQADGRSFLQKAGDKRLLASLIVFAIVALLFVVLYPFGFTRAEGAASPTTDIAVRFGALGAKSFSGWLEFIGFYFKLLWQYETVLFVAALGGVLFLALRKDLRWIFAGAAYVFCYFTLLYLFFNPIARGLLFVLPLFAVFAGFAADLLWGMLFKGSYGRAFKLLLAVLFFTVLLGFQFTTDLRYDWLMSQKDTRLLARDWISTNLPEGTKILVDSQDLRFTNTKEGIRNLQKIDPSGIRIADRTLLNIPDTRYPHPAFYVLNLWFVSKNTAEREAASADFFKKQGFRYLVVEYASADRRDLAPETKALIKNAYLKARFDDLASKPFETSLDAGGEISTIPVADLFKINRFGEYVEIYEF